MSALPGIPQQHVRPFTAPLAEDMEWQQDSACRDYDPEMWFPSGNGGESLMQQRIAERICRECPLASQIGCAKQALASNARYGVWAGQYMGETASSRKQARARLNVVANRVVQVAV